MNRSFPFLSGLYFVLFLASAVGSVACGHTGSKAQGSADSVRQAAAGEGRGEPIDRMNRADLSNGGGSEPLSATERHLEQQGLVDVASLDPSIVVHLIYATADNFTGSVLYRDLKRAYLQADVAAKLLKAQRALKRSNPSLSLIVYDAARPMSVQQAMWDRVKGTSQNIYVANPTRGGGLHNYGAAVDVSLVDVGGEATGAAGDRAGVLDGAGSAGKALPMGTPVDYFGAEAHIDREEELVAQGLLTADELANRLLLRRVMREAGFTPLRSEWWHFNAVSRDEARERYSVIE